MATARALTYTAYSGDNIYGGITPKIAHVYLSSGQSNCQGLGALVDSPIPQGNLVGNVKTWRRNIDGGTMYSGAGAWYGLEYDTNQYETRGQFGSILKCAMNLQANLESVNDDIYFIQADGNGKPIVGWLEGGNENTAMYNHHIAPALQSLKDMGVYDEIRINSFMWIQGESDSLDPADANVYKTRLETLVSDLRTFVGIPTLEIIVKRMESTKSTYTEAATIVAAEEQFVDEDSNSQLITGPWVYLDTVHLDGPSLNSLGDDWYNATLNTRGAVYRG